MKKLLVAGIAVAAFCGGPVFATDMPLRAPVTKAAPAPLPYDPWTGCYVGGNVAGGWTRDSFFFPAGAEDEGHHGSSGWAYGGQGGCDYKLNNNWVVGIQGMFDGTDIKGSNTLPLFPTETWGSKARSFGTVDARFGYLVNPMALLYGKLGVGWVDDRYTFTNPAAVIPSTSASSTRSGFDAGVGFAWMFAPHWDVFLEYDHIFLSGTKSVTFSGVGGGPFTMNIRQNDFDKVLMGIDYHFTYR